MPKKIIGIFTNFRPPPLRQNLKFTKKIALLGERIAQSERTFAGPKWTDVHQCEGKRSAKVGGGQFQFFRKFIFGRSGAHFEWKFEDGTNSKPFHFSFFWLCHRKNLWWKGGGSKHILRRDFFKNFNLARGESKPWKIRFYIFLERIDVTETKFTTVTS